MAERVLTGDQPFRVLKQLGEGGYGVVQLVDHKRFGTVAYKTCPGASSDRQTGLKVEADIGADLSEILGGLRPPSDIRQSVKNRVIKHSGVAKKLR